MYRQKRTYGLRKHNIKTVFLRVGIWCAVWCAEIHTNKYSELLNAQPATILYS